MIRMVHTDGKDKVFRQLSEQLDRNLEELVGAKLQRETYQSHNTLEEIHHVVLCYIGAQAVACASYKEYAPQVAEVKRVYVSRDYRGQGIAKRVINELEQWAKQEGIQKLILETGVKLIPAIHLYQAQGYHTIPNYGVYKNITTSVCMGKDL